MGLQTYLLSKSEHLDMETLAKLWFPREIPNNLQDALKGILRFYLRRNLEPAQNSGPAAYDFLRIGTPSGRDFSQNMELT